MHLYVDASFDASGHSGIGGLLLNRDGQCLGAFSESIPAESVSEIQREDQETIIFELEGLVVAVGLHVFKDLLIGRRVGGLH